MTKTYSPEQLILEIAKEIGYDESKIQKYIYLEKIHENKRYDYFKFSGHCIAPYSECIEQCVSNLIFANMWRYDYA